MLHEVGGQAEEAVLDGLQMTSTTVHDHVEAALISRASQGDEAAFTRLYDLHYDRVFRYIRYRVRHTEDAEDLTQKVFLQAWRALPRYRAAQVPFIAWLITIAHNVAMSFFRSRKPEEYLEDDPSDENAPPDPADSMEERVDREALRQVILRLAPDQQQVISMRFLEGFEYSEIASALAKSEGNVRVIQHRALQQLRKLLEEGVDGNGKA